MKSWILPFGLIAALALGLLLPVPGAFLSTLEITAGGAWTLCHLLVFVIFVVSGLQMRTDGQTQMGQYLRSIVIAIVCNIVLFPLLVLGLSALDIFPAVIVVGASVMACVPTTLSSGIIISKQAGGDEALALIITVVLSIVGVCVLPLSLSILLTAGAEVSIDILALLLKLVILVLIPCAIGFFWSRRFGRPRAQWVALIPVIAIILIVWIVASSKADAFVQASLGLIISIVSMAVLVHCSIFVSACFFAFMVGIESRFKRSLAFTASQKTLPIAVAVLTSIESQLTEEYMAVGIMVCVMWHFSQILIDASIASYWAKM